MESYYLWGMVILFSVAVIYYLVFFSLIYYWHEKKITYIIVPLIFAFEFFIIAFLVFAGIMLLFAYYPEITSIFLN